MRSILFVTHLTLITRITETTLADARATTNHNPPANRAILPPQHQRNVEPTPATARRQVPLGLQIAYPTNIARDTAKSTLPLGTLGTLAVETAQAGIGTVHHLAPSLDARVAACSVARVGAVDVVCAEELAGTVYLLVVALVVRRGRLD